MTRLLLLLFVALLLQHQIFAADPKDPSDPDEGPHAGPDPTTPKPGPPNQNPGGAGPGSGPSGGGPPGEGAGSLVKKILDALKEVIESLSSALNDLDSGPATSAAAPTNAFDSAIQAITPTITNQSSATVLAITDLTPGCISVSSVYASCAYAAMGGSPCSQLLGQQCPAGASNNVNFFTESATAQASCLCYDPSTTFIGSKFDEWASQCGQLVGSLTAPADATVTQSGVSFTQSQAASVLSSAAGLCASAGNVRASPPPTTTTTTATTSTSSIAITSPTSGVGRLSPVRKSLAVAGIGLWFSFSLINYL